MIPKSYYFFYLCCGIINDFLGGQITLVPDEQFVDVLAGVTVNLLEPLLHVVKGFLIGHIVYHNDTMGATIVTREINERTNGV